MRNRFVLFISHAAGRTGAPFVFLHLLRWVRFNTDIRFVVLLREGGDLEDEFHKLAPVHVYSRPVSPKRSVLQRIKRRITTIEEERDQDLHRWLRQYDIGLVYSNTTENGNLLEALAMLRCPVISHLHELEHWIQNHTGPVATRQLLTHTVHYIAGSNAVRDNLIRSHGVSETKIDLIYDCVPVDEWEKQFAEFASDRAGTDELVVGAAGTTDWRKAPDLFVQLALVVKKKRRAARIKFVWVGGERTGREFAKLAYDVQHAGLASMVDFLGARTDYLRVLSSFAVFCLISREDACPLVMLESGLLRKPIVCFEGTGGGPEFVHDGAGFAVPYLDIEAMAERVLALLEDSDLRRRLGSRGHARTREVHDVAVAGHKVVGVIRRFLG